jgi:class 3 adenylate cyclase
MGDEIKITSDSFRVDFKVKVLGTRSDGTVEMAFVPDPERYEWYDDDEHERVLYDLKTNTQIPESVMEEMAEQVAGTPIYGPPAGIPDAADLFARRRVVIESALGGAEHPEALNSPSADLLAEKVGQKQEVAVLSVDVVGSTRLQANEPEAYGRINQILLREIAAVASVFGGAVINFTGDGAVVGFLGPGFNIANDMVFDAATMLVADIYGVMNPALEAAGLFGIDVRVGLDMNQAEVAAVGSEDSRRQHDVLGIAVSMAAKVQTRGAPGEVWVGQTLYETLHISRQKLLEPAPPGEEWDFVNRGGEPYALYRCRVVSAPDGDDG